jgi:hypothetical protein
MNSKNPKFAIAPKGKYNSVIAGVKYEVLNFDSSTFEIKLNGSIQFCLVKGCCHIDGKSWILRDV